MNNNPLISLILATDSYKLSHWVQYPKNTTNVFSYIESRGCNYSDRIMFFGLQYFIRKYLSEPVTIEQVNLAEKFAKGHGVPFNKDGWLAMIEKHGGMFPVRIRALKEGAVVPTHTAMATIEATDPEFYWVVSYLETALLRAVWYPSTVATNSFLCKQTIKKYLDLTADDTAAEINFKLHDFGGRGVSSQESAEIGGMAHIVNFLGSDTIEGIAAAMHYYDCDEVPAYSIPAAEHSTMTSWGKEGERQAYQNMIDQYAKPGAIFAVVSDSWDIYNAVNNIWGDGLLDQVKEKGATVVIRPDSGNPLTVPIEIIQMLMDKVGYTINSKGYKVLPSHVRVIQGDGITHDSLGKILANVEAAGLSASNIAFGMGGGLLQHVNRDTFKFAMKCSAAEVDGKWIDVYKDPVTDSGKRSKKGRMTTVIEGNEIFGEVTTKRLSEVKNGDIDIFHTVYENRPVIEAYETFATVRERAAKFL